MIEKKIQSIHGQKALDTRCGRKGQSSVEFAVGVCLFIPLVLVVIDLFVVYSASWFNDRTCREAARVAASGAPDAVEPNQPRLRAQAVISEANRTSSVKIEPQFQLGETIASMPASGLGGPVQGTAWVETTVTVHPPFAVGSLQSMTFHARQQVPITYVMPASRRQHLSAPPPQDGWQVMISGKALPKYFQFAGATMGDVAQMSVFYAQGTSAENVSVHYEDLFYSNQHAVGCNQFSALSVKPNTTGIVTVTNQSDQPMTNNECYAAANAVGRMFVDLHRKKGLVRQVVVPAASFDGIVGGFCRNGFYLDSAGGQHPPARVILPVVSQPAGKIESVDF